MKMNSLLEKQSKSISRPTKITPSEKFQNTLDKIRFDQKIDSYMKVKDNIKNNQNNKDLNSYQTAKINLLISNSNCNESDRQLIMNSQSKQLRSKTPIQPSPKTAFSECNKKINAAEISYKTKNKMISLIENNLNDYNQDAGRNKNYSNLYQNKDVYQTESPIKSRRNVQYEANSFTNRKNQLLDMMSNNQKDRLMVEHHHKINTKLTHLSDYSKKTNHSLLNSGNYIKISLENMKKTFKLA